MKLPDLQEKLSDGGLDIFSSQELQRLTGMTKNAVRLWLIRQVKNGRVIALKKRRGIYCLAKKIPHDWIIANKLYQPSYISLETALSYYNILLEAVYSVTSVTSRTTRSFDLIGKNFTYQKIKPVAYGGYQTMDIDGQTVIVAEKEKALADYFYFVFLRKKALSERIRIGRIDKKVLLHYLQQFQMPGLVEWSKDVIRKNH